MKPNQNNDPLDIFKTGTTVSDAPSWFDSLRRQIRELREERAHPPEKAKITAQQDPTALDKLVEMPSPVLSLFSDIREAIHDYRYPRKIETTAQAVEVEEIWSKPESGRPKLLSAFGHVLVVSLALVPWALFAPPKLPKVNETAVVVYTPVNLLL